MCFHPTSMSWTGARVFCCPLALCASGTRRRPLLSKSETLRSALQAEHNGHGMRDAKWSISMRSQFPDMRNSAPLQNADVVVVLVPRRAAGASPPYAHVVLAVCYVNLGLAAFKHDPGLPHDRVHNEVEAVEGIIHLVRSARGFRTRRFISTAHRFFTSRAVCAPAPAVRSPRPRERTSPSTARMPCWSRRA